MQRKCWGLMDVFTFSLVELASQGVELSKVTELDNLILRKCMSMRLISKEASTDTQAGATDASLACCLGV